MTTAKEIYNEAAFEYHKRQKFSYPTIVLERPLMRELLSKELSGKKVLDLGCGAGTFTREIKSLGGDPMGVDVSEKMVEIARKENPTIKFVVSDISDLSAFDDNSFEAACSNLVLHYIESLDLVFSELSRVLVEDSPFVFSVRHPLLDTIVEKEGELILVKYPDRGETSWTMMDDLNFSGYKHSFEEYMESLFKNGFMLEAIREKLFTKKDLEELENKKNYELFTKIPMFAVFKARKVNI